MAMSMVPGPWHGLVREAALPPSTRNLGPSTLPCPYSTHASQAGFPYLRVNTPSIDGESAWLRGFVHGAAEDVSALQRPPRCSIYLSQSRASGMLVTLYHPSHLQLS